MNSLVSPAHSAPPAAPVPVPAPAAEERPLPAGYVSQICPAGIPAYAGEGADPRKILFARISYQPQ